MLTFQAPRQIVEHPAVLFDHLSARGISLRERGPTWTSGLSDGVGYSLCFRHKRFLANLLLRVQYSKVSFPQSRDESIGHAALAEMKRPFVLRDQISSVLAEIGIRPLESPIKDEIAYILARWGDSTAIDDILRVVRQEQNLVASAVEVQDFESAARHANRREELLDSLYDLCMLA